jgi:hypothetical protein
MSLCSLVGDSYNTTFDVISYAHIIMWQEMAHIRLEAARVLLRCLISGRSLMHPCCDAVKC